jgi:pantothenate kinase-related protein Tda10
MTRDRQSHGDLARWVAERKPAARALVVGINGAQGSGKSTLARALQAKLASHCGLNAAILSLDDIYMTRAGIRMAKGGGSGGRNPVRRLVRRYAHAERA